MTPASKLGSRRPPRASPRVTSASGPSTTGVRARSALSGRSAPTEDSEVLPLGKRGVETAPVIALDSETRSVIHCMTSMQTDYLVLADRAEAINGKLYMVGGGWDRVGLFQIPGPADFDVGKPPGMKPGQPQRFQLVLRGPFQIPKPGAYHWVVSLDGDRKAITRFWVDQVALPAGTGPMSPTSPR